MTIEFFHPCHPEPQGSASAYPVNGRCVVTSANKKLKPYRKALQNAAISAALENDATTPYFGQHISLRVSLIFTLSKPKSVKRADHVVKPDLDKLVRGTCDALTGAIWHDDAQVGCIEAKKVYGSPEGVHIAVEAI